MSVAGLIEKTLIWEKEHRAKGRLIEALASQVRIETIERCLDKQAKPEFIERWLNKIEGDIVGLRHKVHKPNCDVYYDELLIKVVIKQAILDAWEALYPEQTNFITRFGGNYNHG